MKTTVQQQAFIDELVNGTDNLALRARAGTGKSTTIELGVKAYHEAYPEREILVCAFNKPIADGMGARFKAAKYDWRKVQAATVHSMGYGLVRFVFKSPPVDDKKVRNLIRNRNDIIFKYYGGQINDLVHYAKQEAFGFFTPIGDTHAWYELADHYDVNGLDDTSQMDQIVEAAQSIYKESLEQTDVVDYNDMILFPLIKNLKVGFPKDLLLVDEYQDLSRARQALARKFVKPSGGRMCIVGDDRQCQPAGTMVQVTGGYVAPIEDLKVGDLLVSYSSSSAYFPGMNSQGRKVEAVASRLYSGDLIKITAGKFSHEVTPNHRCLVRMSHKAGSAVYVMKKGKHARIGRCTVHHHGGFGVSMRGLQERADAAWVIAFFDPGQENEARRIEETLAYRFGLPQHCFFYNERGGILGSEQRKQFWAKFPDNLDGLSKCLTEHNLLEEFPFWEKGSGQHIGGYTFELHAANLFDRRMDVCTFTGDTKKPVWKTAQISRRPFKGNVYSLKVQPTEGGRRLYIANGIVTHNSIMAFSGAASDAMPSGIESLNAKVLPLTMTWRCPVSVVKLAQTLVPDIVAAEGAIEGEIKYVSELPADLKVGDAILCRNNAPLIPIAYRLIRKGIACKVEGRSIGEGLLRLVDRWKIKSVDQFIRKLEDYRVREVQKAMARGNEQKVNEVNDRVATLLEICQAVTAKGKHSIDDVRDFINNLFADGAENVVILASYHKSKGREWDRVMLWEPWRCPSKWARQPYQIEQEHNLLYVSWTRTKNILMFVDPSRGEKDDSK